MNLSASGMVRTALVTLAGAGIVIGAVHTQGALALGTDDGAGEATKGATTPVRSSALVCPGPELKGVQGVPDADVSVRVAAAAAPLRALTGTQPPTTRGAADAEDACRGRCSAPP